MSLLSASLLTWIIAAPAHAARFVGDDTAGKVDFDMTASLHGITGSAKAFSGEVTIDDAKPVSGKYVFQANSITTNLNVRDSRMHNYCLEVERFPTVEFLIRDVTGDVEGLRSRTGSGSLVLKGTMTVRSTAREVDITSSYNWTPEGKLRLSGNHELKWSDYGVPDPSIVISTLYPEMRFSFDTTLSERP